MSTPICKVWDAEHGNYVGIPAIKGPKGEPGAPGKDGAGMDITGATVGQIAKITAVDASGVPTAWSPADMPSGGSDDFIINATLGSDGQCTLDKTYAQIRESITAGNNPVVHFADPGTSGTVFMPLTLDFGSGLVFRVTFSIDDGYQSKIAQYTISALQDGRVIFSTAVGLSLDSDGNLRQVTMANDPTADMQIATKKYVDDSVPTALKNPNALTIKIGSTTVTYDGSTAQTVTIADGSEVAY